MGISMMDFFVRESRAIVSSLMVMIRFGTCGGLSEVAVAGAVVVANEGSGFISRNPDSFHSCYYSNHNAGESNTMISSDVKSYIFSKVSVI